ncbi:hypothetical protein NDU88_003748 [Pleurodeles waltl]|uniref:Uncharacterized protein n=1 Tax=Pleurodeles waltl TaxID=8319 RepID=A0AAV7VHP5_PLEWA|nr:hypothetical protein NDU88_003748 [Pleurodeles waltl]
MAQSLIYDTKSLCQALDESSDCSGVLEHIERQLEFLSDVSFDVMRALVRSEGFCVATRHNLVLRDWKTDAAQRSSALQMSFQELILFGAKLEEKLYKLFKEKNYSFSLKSLPGDHQP